MSRADILRVLMGGHSRLIDDLEVEVKHNYPEFLVRELEYRCFRNGQKYYGEIDLIGFHFEDEQFDIYECKFSPSLKNYNKAVEQLLRAKQALGINQARLYFVTFQRGIERVCVD